MTVSIETTSRKYRNSKARTYDAIRKKQERWHLENKYVETMLTTLHPRSVLDVPVGTGRFFSLYRKLGVERVAGVDSSDEMLALAAKKLKGETVLRQASGAQVYTLGGKMEWLLEQRDARDLSEFKKFDAAVCVRFLDLIDEKAMRAVVRELCRLCDAVIFTIRFGEKYVPKANTAEHDEKKFWRLVRELGFARAEEYPIFKAGWRVCMIRRGK